MDDRPTIRCPHKGCRLFQFFTANGMCRKCKRDLVPVVVIPPEPKLREIKPVLTLDIGFAVALIRKAYGLSQPELAAKVGCFRTYISKVETNKCCPEIPMLHKLASALGLPVAGLLEFASI